MAGAERVHVPDPFGEIEGDRKQRQDRNRSHRQSGYEREIEAEGLLRENENRQRNLRDGVGFRHQKRAHRHGPADQPSQHEGADDHDVTRHHEDDQKYRQHADDSERNVNRNDQRLIGQGIEVSAKLALHVETLGEKPVDGIANAGEEK